MRKNHKIEIQQQKKESENKTSETAFNNKIIDFDIEKIRNRSVKPRLFKNILFKIFVIILSTFTTIPLLLILYYITVNGISSINWEFFTELPNPPGEVGGGVLNGILGTFELILVASILSIPLSIALGIYLAENCQKKLTTYISTGVEILQSIPSIVIGIIAYVWVVRPLGGFNGLSGAIALALMMIPFTAKATEETLKMIPQSLKEASLALGVPYYRTILKVVLPASMSGIITGIIVSIARIAGETAPLLFTAFGNPFLTFDLFKPISALPLLIFNYAGSPYEQWHQLAWGASFFLVIFVLVLNIISKLISNKWKIKF